MTTLTARQADILAEIARLTVEQHAPPTVRELAAALGLAPSTVVGHLHRLERGGWLKRRRGRSRGLWVVPEALRRAA